MVNRKAKGLRKALVFGGSGQVGRAIAQALHRDGWQVDATTHAAALPEGLEARHVPIADTRAATIRNGRYDAVVDTMAFNADDAADLLAARASYGQLLVISTASVYADDQGRGFESRDGFPRYPDKITEDQPTVSPGPGYSAQKVAMEQALAGTAATILRPAAIHGIGARHPREWYFVKRMLDGRAVIPIKYGGDSVFHTTSATGIGALASLCLSDGHSGALNVADPEALPVSAIVAVLAATLKRPATLIPVADLPEPYTRVGHSPFSVPQPVRLSTARARALGWDGGADYASLMPAYCDWMAGHAQEWRAAFTAFAGYGHDPFDYAGEDRALALALRTS